MADVPADYGPPNDGVLKTGTARVPRLCSIDLATGMATDLGDIGGSAPLAIALP